MKKIIIISLVILSIVVSAFLALDSSDTPSTNNEGLRKTDVVVNEPSGLIVTFKLNKYTFYVQF
jgi:hypothetical protein